MNRRLLACLLGAGASVGAAFLLPMAFPGSPGFNLIVLITALQELLLIGIPALLIMMRSQASVATFQSLWARPSAYQNGLTMLMAVAFTVVSVLITVIFLMVLAVFGIRQPEWMALVPETPSQLLVAVLCLTIIPAVSEELLFRGLIQGSMAKRWSKTAGIWISALLFALMHRSVLAFPQMLVIGLILGILREHTGSLLLPILFHSFYNFSVLVLNFSRAEPSPGMMMICVMVFVVTFRLLMKGREPDESQGHRV